MGVFEYFRDWLVQGLGYGDGSKGVCPPFDPVSVFEILILHAQHNLSDAQMEFMIRDRLSWMRFLDSDLGEPTPDDNGIRLFRNKLTGTGALKRVMKEFDRQLHKKGCITMSEQIVDASLVPAPSSAIPIRRGGPSKRARALWRFSPTNSSKGRRKMRMRAGR